MPHDSCHDFNSIRRRLRDHFRRLSDRSDTNPDDLLANTWATSAGHLDGNYDGLGEFVARPGTDFRGLDLHASRHELDVRNNVGDDGRVNGLVVRL